MSARQDHRVTPRAWPGALKKFRLLLPHFIFYDSELISAHLSGLQSQ